MILIIILLLGITDGTSQANSFPRDSKTYFVETTAHDDFIYDSVQDDEIEAENKKLGKNEISKSNI